MSGRRNIDHWNRLELQLIRAEARKETVDVPLFDQAQKHGWEGMETCVFCGDPADQQDLILKRRIAAKLGTGVRMLKPIYACDDCLRYLGYQKRESIAEGREFLIRHYEKLAWKERGGKPTFKRGKLRRGSAYEEPYS